VAMSGAISISVRDKYRMANNLLNMGPRKATFSPDGAIILFFANHILGPAAGDNVSSFASAGSG